MPIETTVKGLVSDVRPLECILSLKTDYLFGRLMQEWRGRRLHNNEEGKTDIRECLRIQSHATARWESNITLLRGYVKR